MNALLPIEIKSMHRITSLALNNVNGESVSYVAMTTVTHANGRKFIFNPISSKNEFGDKGFFPFEHF